MGPEDGDTQGKLDTLDALLDDPEVKAALLHRAGEEDGSGRSGNE